MLRQSLTLVLLAGGLLGLGLPAVSGEAYRYADLLNKMVDMKSLAELPVPGQKCVQASSYDRRSKRASDRAGWNANADHGHYLRREEDEYVMADVKGPGCIVRIWSANPQGTLKIYLDDAAKPTLVAPTRPATIFSWQNRERRRTPAGKQEIWAAPEPIGTPGVSSVFCGRRAAGYNLYFPIPFQKQLKVTVDKPARPESLYYHVNVMRYPAGTRLPTWSMDLVRRNQPLIRRIAATLAQPAKGMARSPGEAEVVSLEPGQSTSKRLDGPAAITLLKGKVRAANLRAALRQVVLKITFDGAERPQVWAPVGDFFGTMPGWNLYASLPLGVTRQGAYCRWYMPFGESAEIELVNQGDQRVTLKGTVRVEPISWNDQLGYFHARWRRSRKNTVFDWPFLECQGRGRVVGVALGVFNPITGWWGEGDEKIWIDGESFPSTFGTGSEDYFGYAWCNTALFQHAYHNQTLCEGPGNGNHTSVNRFHILDNLPFTKSIRFTIEDWPLGNKIGKDYCCTTYWYADRQEKDFFTPVPVRDRMPRPAWKPFAIRGLIEGENMQVRRHKEGTVGPQGMGHFGARWSGARQLWWRATGAGDQLQLILDVPKPGVYDIIAYLTKSWDYGTFRFAVAGQPSATTVDLFSGRPGVCVPSGPVSLGRFKLERGKVLLDVEVVGKNEKSPGYYFGLDGILLKPAK